MAKASVQPLAAVSTFYVNSVAGIHDLATFDM